jgi:hypothetical protein
MNKDDFDKFGWLAKIFEKETALSKRTDGVKSHLMHLPEQLNSLFRVPTLTRARMILALAVAVAADGLQLLLGPLGWAFVDQVIDAVAMILVSWIIGFHILLLPTFVVELVPVLEDLPTWTACTAAVIALRKREQQNPPPPPPDKPVIDV